MSGGVDTRFHPRRVVSRESWASAEGGPPQHFATVEDTIPSGGSLVGNAYAAGPFRTPQRAAAASQALQNRVIRRGESPRHRTNTIVKKVL